MRLTKSDLARFWAKVEKTATCWNWTAYLNPEGYGQLKIRDKMFKAHRLSYIIHHGKIPSGLTIDHLCRVTRCVRPDHLEAVTMRVNVLRGDGACARHARQTHCKYGHSLDVGNYYPVKGGGRRCKICHDQRMRLRHRRIYHEQHPEAPYRIDPLTKGRYWK